MKEIVFGKAANSGRFIKWAVLVLLLVVLGGALFVGWLYAASPDTIRSPYLQHYHFRLQVIVEGKAVNFANSSFQTAYSKASCTAALPAQPIHLHDGKDQIVHIHWDGMTGGLLLKYYGWNNVGGLNDVLGYRFDHLPHLKKVPIHGDVLPSVPNGDNFYIYSGDPQNHQARTFSDFLDKDLEVFFNHPSNFPSSKPASGFLNSLFPKVYAREVSAPGATEEQLQQLNNLIGNVVIFVQKAKPSDGQVQDRFNHLEPLSSSVCGG